MGSATELGYRHHRGNPFQRGVQATASTRPGAWAFAHLLPPLDRVTHRLTKGRTTLPAVLAGLPTLMVTTTGRRSGRARTTPLIAVPVGDDLALLGTNFGQPATPAWVLNLEADPRASVDYEGRRCEVVARPATDGERSRVWAASSGVYGGYQKYRSRVTGRDIRIFVLEPADPGAPGAEPRPRPNEGRD
jgi:deazaflavin-dependent oxidoreductase (nitroreductase family)